MAKRISIEPSACVRCFGCVAVCPFQALLATERGVEWDAERCKFCKACVNFCPLGAIKLEGEKDGSRS